MKEQSDGSLTQEGTIDMLAIMTQDQIDRGQRYVQQYYTRRAEVDANYKEEWDYLQKLYECKRDPVKDDEDFPNSFIALITPTVEGQVASMLESQIEFSHVTNNPGHKAFMSQFDAASEYYRKKSHFKEHLKDFTRYYDLLGNCYLTVSWEDSISNNKTKPNGYPRISVPPILSILVDGKIKDSKDLQYAEYIIQEVGYVPISYILEEYGEAYADAAALNINRIEGDDADLSYDDTDSVMLLRYWTRERNTHHLHLVEMDVNGIIYRESNPDKSFYTHVDNEYPFVIARMMPQLGKFYGFGDGALLVGLQQTVNNLTDELELAARFSAQSKVAVDPSAGMSGDQLTTNPADPIYCKDPVANIKVLQSGGINAVVPNFIEICLREAQRITRFHDVMTGNMSGSSATATQVNSQMTQGSVGIKDKKSDIAEVMKWADSYALKLCMQYWDKPFWAGIGKNATEFVDFQGIMQVPNTVPLKNKTLNKLLESDEFSSEPLSIPTFETALDEQGEVIFTDIDFDTNVIIGNAMPKGKTDMYNILLSLAQVMTRDKNGATEPIISAEMLRSSLEDILGMKLRTEEEEYSQEKQQMEQVVQESLIAQNPLRDNNTVQNPNMQQQQQKYVQAPPENLASVPGVNGSDKRGLQ
jgi:hypothetical protein